MTLDPDTIREALQLVSEGWSAKAAGEKLGITDQTVRKYVKKAGLDLDALRATHAAAQEIPGPLQIWDLEPTARDCLDDFARFRHRFFGRKSSPWQEHAADLVKTKLATELKEYGVINVAPGTGKSTLFTHDIPAWLTARNRAIRGFIGSSTQTLANGYTNRLRQMLEADTPLQANTNDIRLGLGSDAASTMAADYGRFRPIHLPERSNPPWAKNQFTVEQHVQTPTGQKEASWTAFGEDTGFLGWRVDFIVWDDLVTDASVHTTDAIEKQRRWWINSAETRLEPGGLLILQGQRLHAEDLYRFCLDVEVPEDVFELEELADEATYDGKKYFHVVYKAHFDENCTEIPEQPGLHKRTDPPYDPRDPDNSGCLIDPARLTWRELRTKMEQPLTNFRVVYQQEDSDPDEVLVPKIWIEGGRDHQTGHNFAGCLDHERVAGQAPPLRPPWHSTITIDPSPTKHWSVQWWIYTPPVDMNDDRGTPIGQRHLIDMYRGPMDSGQLLDFNLTSNTWTGLLEDWWVRSKKAGAPYSTLVIEHNAAQRFLYQYDWFRRWTSARSVTLLPHATGANKADQEYGVQTIAPHYRFARVRIPYGDQHTRTVMNPLIHELTHYPNVTTDDCVMANWFHEYQLPRGVLGSQPIDLPDLYPDRPTWAAVPA